MMSMTVYYEADIKALAMILQTGSGGWQNSVSSGYNTELSATLLVAAWRLLSIQRPVRSLALGPFLCLEI